MLNDLEKKFQQVEQRIMELKIKRQAAQERVEQLSKELGGVTLEDLEKQKQSLQVEREQISKRLDEILASTNL